MKPDDPVFDRAAFAAACLNDPAIIRDVLAAFAASRQAHAAAVVAAVEAGDVEAVERSAHKLKGALGTIRAQAGHRAAEALVAAARAGATERFPTLLAVLQATLADLDLALAAEASVQPA